MNPIVILIAIIFVILMVAFGRNPIEEAQQERQKKLAGKDPLIEAIEEHNKGHSVTQGWFGGPPQQNGAGGGQMPSGNAVIGGNNAYRPTGAAPRYPGYMMRNGQPQNPYYTNPYQQNQQAPAQDTAPDSYYPPSATQPSQKPHSDNSHDLWIPTLAGVPPMYLRSGQKVAFFNTSVYTYNADGKLIPMPDGKYVMFDGRGTLVVKGGRKIIY